MKHWCPDWTKEWVDFINEVIDGRGHTTGDLNFDIVKNQLKVWNETAWVSLTLPGGGGTPDLSGYLQKSGGTMTGTLVLAHDPLNPDEAATMRYVDDFVADVVQDYLPLNGGIMTGVITFATGQTISGYLPLTGGTLTGMLTMQAEWEGIRFKSSPTSAYTQLYYGNDSFEVALFDASNNHLYSPIRADTFGGVQIESPSVGQILMMSPLIRLDAAQVLLQNDPTVALGAVTKQYADQHVLQTFTTEPVSSVVGQTVLRDMGGGVFQLTTFVGGGMWLTNGISNPW